MAVFLCLIVAMGYFIGYYYQNPVIIYIALAFALSMNVFSYWYSDKVALSLARAKPADRNIYPELFRIVENLSITAGLPMPRLYIIQETAPNAFATGRNKEHAAVAVTTGLLSLLDKNELEGVVAHELAHIGNKDILLQTIVVVLVGFIAILANIFLRTSFFGGRSRRDSGGNAGAIMAIVGIIFVILSPIVAQIIQLAISRKREFLADANGALLTRYPDGLASALAKIDAYHLPMNNANNATAHLFISNPFGSKATKGLSKLFMTHPPMEERIKALRGS